MTNPALTWPPLARVSVSSMAARAIPTRSTRSTGWMISTLATILVSALATGCGDDEPAVDPTLREGRGTRVMIIDEGFDLSHPSLQDKVEAAYTVVCQPDSDVGAADAAATFEETRTAMLEALAQPDETCTLRAGIAPIPDPFADLESDRLSWNAAIHSSQLASAPPIADQLALRLLFNPFHGTATAGIIAHANPGVRLVLVERGGFRSPVTDKTPATATTAPTNPAPATTSQSSTCLAQGSLDQVVALLSDPEVHAAHVARPASSLDRALAAAAAAGGVGIVNESFGRLTRAALEELLAANQCPPVSLGPYFAVQAALERAHDAAHLGPADLVMKAAGNDGARLDGPEDSAECRIGDPRRLLIGSLGLDGQRSSLSNFGACVDLYAPGEGVIVPLPGDWVFPLSGTSFAAPLVARLVSLGAPRPFEASSARAYLLGLRGPRGEIPASQFPEELLWKLGGTPNHGSAPTALATVGPPSMSMSVSVSMSALKKRPPAVVDALALHRWLWPVRWLEGRHGAQRF